MANASNSFEDFLPIDYDLSAVNDLVGTLESQLSGPTTKESSVPNSENSITGNHIGSGSQKLTKPTNNIQSQKSLQVSNNSPGIPQRPGSAGNNITTHQVGNKSQVNQGNTLNNKDPSTAQNNIQHQMTRTNMNMNHIPQHVVNNRVPSPHQTMSMGSPVNNVSKQYSPNHNRSLNNSPISSSLVRPSSPLTFPVSAVPLPSPTSQQGTTTGELTNNNRVITQMQPGINNMQLMQPNKQIVIKSLDIQKQNPGVGNVHIVNVACKNLSVPNQNVFTIAQSMSTFNTASVRSMPMNVSPTVAQRFNPPTAKIIRPMGQHAPIKIAAAAGQVNIAPRPLTSSTVSNSPVSTPSTITLPPGYQLPAGTMLMKNEQGHLVLIQTNQGQGLPMQNKVLQKVTTQPSPRPITPSGVVRVGTPQTNSHAHVVSSTTAAANQTDHVKKCKNFLSTLLKLASSQPPQIIKNVRELIQNLVDGKIEPEMFTEQLQVELKSSPQPNLVPFLKKSLPSLRAALAAKNMAIDGVWAPQVTKSLPSLRAALAAKNMAIDGVRAPQVTVLPSPSTNTSAPNLIQPSIPAHTHMQVLRPITVQQMQQMRGTTPNKTVAMATPVNKAIKASPTPIKPMLATGSPRMTQNRVIPPTAARDKRKFETLKEDDDINDVATMGGVNLSEESRNILATNSEIVGTQERSCAEESFLYHDPLIARISSIGKKHGIDYISSDVATLISHATQERLRDLAARLSTIAEHRTEIYKMDPKYEASSAVRTQLKFLEELDKLEKKRHGEQEREILLRAAKSRTKTEDPEQVKLKQKAKELQQAEMEEARQREANLTALAAIGPRRKKMKESVTQDTTQPSASDTSPFSTPRPVSSRQRTKRVSLKDLLFLLEQEKTSAKSKTLYKAFLK